MTPSIAFIICSEQGVTVYYHDMFRKIGKYSDAPPLAAFLNSAPEQYNWLMEHLNLYGVYHSNYPKRVSSNVYWWVANKMQRIQERLYF